jgi:hypothetical protein
MPVQSNAKQIIVNSETKDGKKLRNVSKQREENIIQPVTLTHSYSFMGSSRFHAFQ